jgi:hypothetical protein
MRKILTFTATVLFAAGTWAAGDVYRWKDAGGTWHYSDQPQPGAQLVSRAGRAVSNATPAANAPAAAPAAPASSSSEQAPPPVSDAVAAQVRAEAAAAKSEQCKKADEHYQNAVKARMLKREDGTFLNDTEIDAYRLKARSVRDLACGPGA